MSSAAWKKSRAKPKELEAVWSAPVHHHHHIIIIISLKTAEKARKASVTMSKCARKRYLE
jgi:hypothetical protein